MAAKRTGVRLPGILLGVGLGGFVDGIVLHQVLQWHNMLSAWDPPVTMEAMRRNMRWDGLFHALTWACTAAGLWLFYRAAVENRVPSPGRLFVGDMVLGWGLFNLVEGLIDHQLLGIHHVREVPAWLTYDVMFLAVGGVGLIVAGLALGSRREVT
ncbi:MAG TPA: DUF2243 domain-containing protein [Gemmatimonadales bacterium]|nr:DUF2243 domain-containing protein [Gemmatimonadales bacterium]